MVLKYDDGLDGYGSALIIVTINDVINGSKSIIVIINGQLYVSSTKSEYFFLI